MEQNRENIAQIAPFAVWMGLMFVLPSAPWAYAVRSVATIVALVWGARGATPSHPETASVQQQEGTASVRQQEETASVRRQEGTAGMRRQDIVWGVAMGLVVLAIWVWPEKQFEWYRAYCMTGYTANAPVDGSAWWWKAIRLLGSAFVISVAEELFFRKWLLRTAGFGWMVVLFAVEHNRWLVAAITGALYGWLAIRKRFASAVIAHIVTNLTLGVYVLVFNDWAFW